VGHYASIVYQGVDAPEAGDGRVDHLLDAGFLPYVDVQWLDVNAQLTYLAGYQVEGVDVG
jgi:hypothetical protein